MVADHWPSGPPGVLELISDLEKRFDPLEDWRTGTRVGIGVATGCDDVFVVEDASGVERCRLLPMLTVQDVASGTPRWSGRFLVNPWEEGRLVDLEGVSRPRLVFAAPQQQDQTALRGS